MCGIAGIVRYGDAVEREQLERLTSTLAPRGPDACHFSIVNGPSASFGFGHRRLAIIGSGARGAQPASLGGRWWLTFNGAVYNFVELAQGLGWAPDEIALCSDTEVLLHMLARHGRSALDRLDGMWAFGLWDAQEETLTLSRDRFGEKPLFYSKLKDGWAFASEVQAFRAHPETQPELNDEVAAAILGGQFIPQGQTLLRGVHELPAGSIATFARSHSDCSLWWDTLEHLPPIAARYEDRVDEFRTLLVEAVSSRMRADVPIACSLSGGFDSSAIAATMTANPNVAESRRGTSACAFVVCSPWSLVDETPAARRAASFAGLRLHEVHSPQEVSIDQVEHALDALDGIYGAPPLVAHQLYAYMRQSGVYCSLEGHGLDELIGGYVQLDRSTFAEAPSLLTSPIENIARLQSVHAFHCNNPQAKGASAIVATMRSFALHHPEMALVRRALTRHQPQSEQRRVQLGRAHEAGLGAFGATCYAQFHSSILPKLLMNVDRTSMHHGIEVRSPFLAWKLVAYATALPDSDRFKDGVTKRIARDAMSGLMDESIRTQPIKLGYYTPLREWLSGSLSSWARERLNATSESTFEATACQVGRDRLARFNRFPSLPNAYSVWIAISLVRYSKTVRRWAQEWHR